MSVRDSGTVPKDRARAQSLATLLVLELADAVFRIRFDYEHRFAEHEQEQDLPFMIAHPHLADAAEDRCQLPAPADLGLLLT